MTFVERRPEPPACRRAPVLRARDDGGAIDPAAIGALHASGRIERLEVDSSLRHEETECPPQGILLAGILRHQRYGPEGERQIVNLLLPGEALRGERLTRQGCTIEAATPATFLRLRPAAFDALCAAHPSLAAAAYRSCNSRLDRLLWLTWAILALRTEERIAAFLCCAGGMMPVEPLLDGGTLLTLTLQRRDIADLLATSVESVCRSLKGLEREGLIRMRSARHVEIREAAGLRARGRIADKEVDCPFDPAVRPRPQDWTAQTFAAVVGQQPKPRRLAAVG